MGFLIRKASIEDVANIAKVHVASWQSTYKGIINEKYLRNLSIEQRTELWIKNIQNIDNTILVAVENNQIVGFASGASARDDEYPSYDGDVTAIYFYKEFQGKGLGKRLIYKLFVKLKERGFKNAIVKVLADNHNKNFYEKLGAKRIDQSVIQIGEEKLTLLTFAWDEL